jgi:hypothetical protein
MWMACMRIESLRFQAELCRRQAAQFAGRAEGPILMRLADSFEALAAAGSGAHGSSAQGSVH